MQAQQSTTIITPFTVLEITERDVITKLRSYAEERRHAIKAYPFAHGANEKLEAIEQIIYNLDRAEACRNPSQAIKIVLTTALNFHFIAPRQTHKLFAAWYEKVEDVMRACRQFLGWRAQS
ncbi:hypothetical protein [Mucilaginibacter sp.]|uniref:hypothetical protein n=1 Tax=Mucilaginibacter sp. TaxID=1882438 RepID=UPI00261970BE|nr:hypothetical protein [Mucilaginibacter sp.]MDB4919823.1 hypothetical protein [Mucilaginibacter sp.]